MVLHAIHFTPGRLSAKPRFLRDWSLLRIGKEAMTKDPRGWVDAKRRKPKLTEAQRKPSAFGVQVLIWPPYKSEAANDVHVAFYGCRHSDRPEFYIYGRVIDVTHWQHLPKGPLAESVSYSPNFDERNGIT